ncbi:Nucleolar and spindle-associated protein 1 [Myotis davidii]|uniref:Nucleolar and spindle-associated protein 1 n=1 Tax=Myotis davidii TaxID=225400 RepID=L5LA16_MYODS|nr:Nucleolar and spindle-associated protein 1 [Myotis davidii]
MTIPSLEDLNSFKYSDLQNLAKNLGLQVNLRADMLKALKAHLTMGGGPTESQNQEKQEDESQRDENAVSSEESGVNGNEESKAPSERKKSVYIDGFSKLEKIRVSSTTPNFKKLHEAHF